jgi:hypothetical protein
MRFCCGGVDMPNRRQAHPDRNGEAPLIPLFVATGMTLATKPGFKRGLIITNGFLAGDIDMTRLRSLVMLPLLLLGCNSSADRVEVARTKIANGREIIQFAPQGNATVDDYLLVYCVEPNGSSEKQVLAIKGRKDPLKVRVISDNQIEVEVNSLDIPMITFFDSGIKNGKVSIHISDNKKS